MKKLLMAALIAGMFSASAFAGEYQNKFMSINVANGWSIEEDPEGDGTYFFAPNKEAVLTVSKIDAEGLDLKGTVEQLAAGMEISNPKVTYMDNGTAQFMGPNNSQVTVGMEGKYAIIFSVTDNTGKYTNDIKAMLSSVKDK